MLRDRLKVMWGRLDMLRSPSCDGMPKSSGDGKALENAVAEYYERMDDYARELDRLSHLELQAWRMLDRARDVLADGGAHWIGTAHIDVLELHYLAGMTYAAAASRLRIAESTAKAYASHALDWLDSNRDADGHPLVPIVSE